VFSQWLEKAAAGVAPEKTLALLVDHTEVQKLDCLSHLHGSKEWRQDLTLHKHQWVYNPSNGRRMLVL